MVLVAAMAVAVAGVRGQGGTAPILVVLNDGAGNPYDNVLPEILRAEGINSFNTIQLADLDASDLTGVQLVVLSETPLSGGQATLLTTYVNGGGRLVAMRPDSQLDGVLGISRPVGALPVTNGYLLVDQSGPGAGLQAVTLPFKGSADRYDLAGASTVATLYTSATLSDGRPAVVRTANTAAWSFDLGRSTAYTRQGDPALAGTDRDGDGLVRTVDVFYNVPAEPAQIDKDKVGLPHADIQMRLFSRVIADLLADAGPLPRLWYFPNASRTVLVATADSHSPPPAVFSDLQNAVQAAGGQLTFYLARFYDFSTLPIQSWLDDGNEVAMHPYFETFPPPADTFPEGYAQIRNWFTSEGVTPGATVRHHRIEWSGWVGPVATMQANAVRMDLTYYTWGRAMFNPTRTSQAHGYITGSGLPMRFVDTAGQVLPVYQQVTSLVDEQLVVPEPDFSEGLTAAQAVGVSRSLINASQDGGYSAIATQFHVDYYQFGEVKPWVDGTLAYAASQQVPIWPAGRWLDYTEARAATAIAGMAWVPGTGTLSFTVAVPDGAEAQTVALPRTFDGKLLANVTLDGQTIAPTQVAVNGTGTAMFSVASAGGAPRSVVAQYLVQSALPALTIGDLSVPEGNAGSTAAQLTVSLTGPAHTADVTVHYATSPGTATAGADYSSTSGTLTFPVGTTSLPVPVPVLGDTGFEPDETFSVTLSSASGATIADATAVATIVNDDPEPIIFDTSAGDFSVCSIHTGTRAAAGGDVRLLGTFRDDFTAATFDPRWVAGNPFGPGAAPTPSAGLVTLLDPFGAELRSAAEISARSVEVRAQFTDADDQSIGLADIGFGTPYARFSTELGGGHLWAVTNPGSGDALTDLGLIPAGFHDYTLERETQGVDEIVRYRIDGVVVAEHTLLAGELPLPLVLFMSNRGTTGAALTIDRVESDPPFVPAGTFQSCVVDALQVMNWGTLDWDAVVPAGTTLAVSTRTSIDNTTWSAWSAPLGASGAAIASPPGRYLQYRLELATTAPSVSPIVRLVQGDVIGPATPLLSIAPVTVPEAGGAAVFTASLSWPSASIVTASYATSSGTATSGLDFTPASGLLTFTPGDTAEPVSVAITNDVLDEPDETFTVTLSAPSGATIAVAQAIGTITDDDTLPTAVADAYTTPFNTPLVVAAPGVLANDTSGSSGAMTAELVSGVAHGTLALGAAGSVNYTPASGYAGADSFVYRVVTDSGTGNSVTVSITVGVPAPPMADTYTTPFQTTLTVAAPGVLGNDGATAGLTAQLVAGPGHGTLTLAANGGLTYAPDTGFAGEDGFTYRTQGPGGSSVPATVTITVSQPTDVQPPQELRVSSIAGNVVTLRWKAPAIGPEPTGFVLEGGVAPGQTLVAMPTGHAAPIFTLTAPNGSFVVRVRSLGPGGQSATSNEIPLHVNVPMAPAAPTALQATTSGSALHLAWTPSFAGGRNDGVMLDVTGSVAASIPLAAQERISLAGVPAGSYTLRVRSTNASGSSAASAPITVTVPGLCAAAPEPPANLLAYVVGGTTSVVWDPPATGDAPVGYQISVPGIGVLPTGARTVSGPLPAGTYALEVRSVGACGISAPASFVLTVP
jgi:hypothetical protein